ncbi:GGDEF domain-containing protein [Streptomyces sp. NBC_00669]|uniref:GGDEF domain-containing protein n=1 Tax=Streptomyces sp. NBC_00669 TaxID=2976011 RepID=UPI002E36F67B|nr:GGDEF domain-containing protein [Streptomyces sp. NBC_00669]
MNTLLAAVAAGVAVAAGWSAHLVWLRGRLTAARRDPLTGLWTREAFTRRAARLLHDPRAVVVLADVDHFKQVNDTHGHAAGDALLAATAARLAHYTGRAGVAGRLGGDEFAAVLIDRDGTAADLLAVLGGVLARPADGIDPAVHTTVSLGWARAADFPDEGLPELLRRADEAMYAAKRIPARVRRAGLGSLLATLAGRRPGRRGTGPGVAA